MKKRAIKDGSKGLLFYAEMTSVIITRNAEREREYIANDRDTISRHLKANLIYSEKKIGIKLEEDSACFLNTLAT